MQGRFETITSILKGKETEMLIVKAEGDLPDEIITLGKLWGLIDE